MVGASLSAVVLVSAANLGLPAVFGCHCSWYFLGYGVGDYRQQLGLVSSELGRKQCQYQHQQQQHLGE